MTTNTSIGVVIPAYNPDIETLVQYVADIHEVFSPEVIRIEIDAPRQSNVNRLEKIAEVNVSGNRRGKGCAIMDGFDALETDILSFTDADGAVSATSLSEIILQIEKGFTDVSIGSRRHPSSNILNHQTVVRRRLGDIFAFTARKMLPIKCQDYQCGAKAIHSDAWEEIGHHCYEPGFAWDLEFISVAGSLGYDIVELPVDWKDHPDSTVDPISTSIELASSLVEVKHRTNAIKTSPRFRKTHPTNQSILKKEKASNDD